MATEASSQCAMAAFSRALRMWLLATHIMAESKEDMNTLQMSCMIGVTYETDGPSATVSEKL